MELLHKIAVQWQAYSCACLGRIENTLESGRENTMSMLTNLDLIRRVPLFSMLTNDQAQAIADSVVKRRFRRGVAGRTGTEDQDFGVLVRGAHEGCLAGGAGWSIRDDPGL